MPPRMNAKIPQAKESPVNKGKSLVVGQAKKMGKAKLSEHGEPGPKATSAQASNDAEDNDAKGESGKSNVEVLVEYVLNNCARQEQADECFRTLLKVGHMKNPTGRTYAKGEVEEAHKKYNRFYGDPAQTTVPAAKPSPQPSPEPSPEASPSESEADPAQKDAESAQATIQKSTSSSLPGSTSSTKASQKKKAALAKAAASASRKLQKTVAPSDAGKRKQAERSDICERLGLGKRQKKVEKKSTKRTTTRRADEAMFGSESEDDLSGEEEVDLENDDAAAKFSEDLDLQKGQEIDDLYPAKVWQKTDHTILPGHKGFNERASKVMQYLGVGASKPQTTFDKEATCPPLQPHQEVVAFLLHPSSPITRMLIDHPTGSGKTREMIRTLDNYFFDPRAKIPIFPKDHVCRNFYAELLRWPNRYRNYFCCEKPEAAAALSGVADWRERRFHMWDLAHFTEAEVRELCYAIREVLEMKNMFYRGMVRRSFKVAFNKKNPNEYMPRAPLRALGYTSAGGSFSTIKDGVPQSSLMKIGFEKGSKNVYNNKVVIMDEAHNLLTTDTQYASQLGHLRTLLSGAKNLVLAGFTGTPILSDPKEGHKLLQIIKGSKETNSCDEGFLSAFPMRPKSLFPVSLPSGIPDGILTEQRKKELVEEVELKGETLRIYDIKRRTGYGGRMLRAYCNCSTYHGSFHDGKSGTKIRVLTWPEECCPKLYAIAMEVARSPEKAVIMTSRMSGYNVMLELMQFVALKQDNDNQFGVATMDELSEFNHVSNLRGEIFRVLVADAAQCSEGVSFLAVRRTFISDVPESPSKFIQQCGRAIRMYGHRGLPKEEQTVTNKLYVAKFPSWLNSSLACWALRAQSKNFKGKEFEKKASDLTNHLHEKGFNTLADLKARLDPFGGKVKILTSLDVATFLEHYGLGDEATSLRKEDAKEKEKAAAVFELKGRIIQAVEAQEGLPVGGLTGVQYTSRPTASLDASSVVGVPDSAINQEAGLSASPIDGITTPNGPESEANEVDRREAAERAAATAGKVAKPRASVDDPHITPEDWAEPDAAGTEHQYVVVRDNGLAVTEQFSRRSDPVGMLPAGAGFDVLEIANEEDEGRVRALIKNPPGWVSLRSGSEYFASKAHVSDEEFQAGEEAERQAANVIMEAPTPASSVQPTTRKAPTPAQSQPAPPPKENAVEILGKAVDVLRDACSESSGSKSRAQSPKKRRRTGGTPGDNSAGNDAPSNDLADDMDVDAGQPSWAGELEGKWRIGFNAAIRGLLQSEFVPLVIRTIDPDFKGKWATVTREKVRSWHEDFARFHNFACSMQALAATQTALQDIASKPADDSWRAKFKDQLQQLFVAEDVEVACQTVQMPADIAEATPERVRALQDELIRQRHQGDIPQTRSRALVTAIQSVYSAKTVEEAELLLSPVTADQEALRNLALQTHGFAPALTELRSVAADRQVLSHLAAESDCTDAQDSVGSAKASHGQKRKAPTGKLDVVPGQVVKMHSLWSKPELNGQLTCARKLNTETDQWVSDLLPSLYKEVVNVDASHFTFIRHSDKMTREMEVFKKAAVKIAKTRQPARGDKVKLHSLVAKPELNDQEAKLVKFISDTGRWECQLLADPEAPTVNIKPANFTLIQNHFVGATPADELLPAPGVIVKLHSLQARPELNGQLARIESYNQETERWVCKLQEGAQGEVVNLKDANIKVLPAAQQQSAGTSASTTSGAGDEQPQIAAGKHVRLHGLTIRTGRPELNGQLALIERYIPESGRWKCLLLESSNGESMNFSASNLKVVQVVPELPKQAEVPKQPEAAKQPADKPNPAVAEKPASAVSSAVAESTNTATGAAVVQAQFKVGQHVRVHSLKASSLLHYNGQMVCLEELKPDGRWVCRFLDKSMGRPHLKPSNLEHVPEKNEGGGS